MLTTFRWTVDSLAQLKRCIDNKLSAGDTAAALGCTRNTVIGKANRLGLKFRSESRRNTARTAQAEETATLEPVALPWASIVATPLAVTYSEIEALLDEKFGPNDEPVTAPAGGVTIADLRSCHCRAIIGDAPTRYCGAPVTNNRFTFCAEHAAVYLTTPAKMRAEREKVGA